MPCHVDRRTRSDEEVLDPERAVSAHVDEFLEDIKRVHFILAPRVLTAGTM